MSKSAPFRLYAISESLDALLDRLDDFENPISDEEIKSSFAKINEDQAALFSDLRYAVINMKAQKETAKAEADRLYAMSKASELKEEKLKTFIFDAMQKMGSTKVAFPDGGYIRVQANSSPSVLFEGDPKTLPKGFFRVKETYSIDADAVHQAKAMDIPLPPGVTVVKGSHLRLA